MPFADQYIAEAQDILQRMSTEDMTSLAEGLAIVRGSVFIVGLGGSAAHATHAAADFNAFTRLLAVSLVDNVPALTAAANDETWETMFRRLLERRYFGKDDALLVLSVGGGTDKLSRPIVDAVQEARRVGARIFGIVGRDGGWTRTHAHACVVIPRLYPERVTAHTEGLMSVVLHGLMSHPALAITRPTWESRA